jgi:hypothetical protein
MPCAIRVSDIATMIRERTEGFACAEARIQREKMVGFDGRLPNLLHRLVYDSLDSVILSIKNWSRSSSPKGRMRCPKANGRGIVMEVRVEVFTLALVGVSMQVQAEVLTGVPAVEDTVALVVGFTAARAGGSMADQVEDSMAARAVVCTEVQVVGFMAALAAACMEVPVGGSTRGQIPTHI